ncbi:G-type lectin S-receptor-like serine/threonine-protein kinase SD1-1 [Bidens hawaiensis]|uniref:G-type lectin S-receptor-like serine/threonine-protein kinase SD1-1 n=1 Tax=Bidens hawaiensis TaxID=980011 RepID=UPI004049F43E
MNLFRINKQNDADKVEETQDLEVTCFFIFFSLSTLVAATNNFSDSNKLGQGGFGPVYKGCLKDGREVAVKRLSTSSSQGVEEFRNEVVFISRLQHRNLVKILGYCFKGQEKMLVYEYMPNKGLDQLLFHDPKSKTLDWSKRFHIIDGIARGLLYLHQDSRLQIIHRDLKPANILLDHDLNPKISDFGLARSFGGNDTQTKTKRVVGTYGYMSPEYAGRGIFSVKSDVFSFGVLTLEIVSGIQSRCSVLEKAWNHYKEGKLMEFAELSLIELDHTFEVLRSIQVGLLCVQNNPEDRPNMSTVVMMLSSDSQLPEPKHPGFYTESSCASSSSIEAQNSYNNVTVTLMTAR